MIKLSEYTLEALNSQADLISIIGKHTKLKPAGKEFKGCCPFHGEKTPSFFVNPHNNLYYCFSCGAKGNAISFLMDYEKQTFMEAVRTLSSLTGISLPKDDNKSIHYTKTNNSVQKSTPNSAIHNTPSSTDPQTGASSDAIYHHASNKPKHNNRTYDNEHENDTHSNHTQSINHQSPNITTQVQRALHNKTQNNSRSNTEGNLYELLDKICHFYEQNLRQNAQAYAYFKNRGLSDNTIQHFNLGYAPNGWNHLEQTFSEDIEGLKILGLVRISQKGKQFDLLRDRVIFPIKDGQGRIVGFAGRTLDDSVQPKYINSSDSVVFNKNQVLYGYYESRQKRAQNYVIVEGYMDVIAS